MAKYIENLMEVTSSDDERNTLKQVLGMFKEQINPLNKLIATIRQKPGHFVSSKATAGDIFHSTEPNRTSLQESQQKLRETQKMITNWENPLITDGFCTVVIIFSKKCATEILQSE